MASHLFFSLSSSPFPSPLDIGPIYPLNNVFGHILGKSVRPSVRMDSQFLLLPSATSIYFIQFPLSINRVSFIVKVKVVVAFHKPTNNVDLPSSSSSSPPLHLNRHSTNPLHSSLTDLRQKVPTFLCCRCHMWNQTISMCSWE